jgi:hypothetical protein
MPAMNDRFGPLRMATAAALLNGQAATAPELRQAIAGGNPPPELTTLVDKIRSRAYTAGRLDGLGRTAGRPWVLPGRGEAFAEARLRLEQKKGPGAPRAPGPSHFRRVTWN